METLLLAFLESRGWGAKSVLTCIFRWISSRSEAQHVDVSSSSYPHWVNAFDVNVGTVGTEAGFE